MTLWWPVTMRGVLWVGGVFFLVVVIWVIVAGHDFLAISDPVPANVLVVEAWAWQSASMQEAAKEFIRGRYDIVVTVGVLPERYESGSMHENPAARAAERLRKLGVDHNSIVILSVPNVKRHRTYTSALAVKQWLIDSETNAMGVNVFTLGAHARKSLVLFGLAFDNDVPVGVIAGVDDKYSPERWWLSIRGVYTVLWNTVGYLYAEWWPLPDKRLASSGLSFSTSS
jgi:hypothetical protein